MCGEWRWVVPTVVLVLLAGCTADDDGQDEAGSMDETTTTEPAYRGAAPQEISPAPADGEIIAPQPAPPLPDGYVEEEFFVAGAATSFDASDTPDHGAWDATPADEADYRTRVIVRRPADAAEFSGTVLVEWFNVSALEAAPDWAYLSGAIGRDGHAYVGVSAQAQGVEGGDTLLDVEVDPEQADAAGEDAAAADPGGLKHADPDRYSTLEHPGDAYSYDVFSQVGRAVAESPGDLLADLEPQQVIAMGESQSAMFLATLINAVHLLDPTFDGFLVHSRGATVPSLDGTYTRSADREDGDDGPPSGVLLRTDLDVPVMQVEAETDLTLLGFVHARQPDTDLIRTWEIAGTAHADSETLRAALGGPRDPEVGDLLGCGPVNSGPHKEVLRAAMAHLVEWTSGGRPPPEGDRLEVDTAGDPAVVRDERGNALGGVRTPMVDVPAATLTGEPAEGSDGICSLFGQTIPFDQDTLVELYGGADTYFEQFRVSADEAVDAGFLLRADADALIEDMEPNRARFP